MLVCIGTIDIPKRFNNKRDIMETVYYNKSFFKKKKLIQTNAQRYFILTLAVTIPPILATTVNVTLIHDKMNA